MLFVREGNYFLYNTKTLSLLLIDKSTYDLINLVKKSPDFITQINEDTLSVMSELDIIDDDTNSECNNFRHKLEYLKRIKSFCNRTLSLVIAPTLACNFACPYCYEANLPLSIMKEDVEDKIIEFINSFRDRCDSIEICWEGGEPLLGFDRIQSLLEKIRSKSCLPIVYHSMITNGYLLTEEIVKFLYQADLNFIQITIDGIEETHNKSRILKNGGKSYRRIISNIDMITKMMPECLVVVRTNVHDGNKNEFGTIYKEFCERWKNDNVKILPAFVVPNSNCKVTCCTPHEKSAFFVDLKQKEHINNIDFVPKHKIGTCSTTSENSYIISPDGNLYKCWNDIGIENRRIGNIFNGISNNTLIAQYMIGSDKFKDHQCIECSMFPICDGGCNRQRMDSQEQSHKHSPCPFTEDGIANYLYEHYKSVTK